MVHVLKVSLTLNCIQQHLICYYVHFSVFVLVEVHIVSAYVKQWQSSCEYCMLLHLLVPNMNLCRLQNGYTFGFRLCQQFVKVSQPFFFFFFFLIELRFKLAFLFYRY